MATALLALAVIAGRAFLAPAGLVASPGPDEGAEDSAFLAPTLIGGRAYLAPALRPAIAPTPISTPPVLGLPFLAPALANGRAHFAARLSSAPLPPIAFAVSVRFNVLPRDFRTRIIHFSK